ncbi:Long-chain-fatty-acid--CoA ligase [compost metagenome]
MIISSGFKIFPSEVERVLMEHSAVTECAVASAADPKAGEVPIAYVVLGDASVDEAVLLKFCEERLVAYKRPRRIVFRKELPKSSVGKILRRELRVM